MGATQIHLHNSTDLENVVPAQISIIIKHKKNTSKMHSYWGWFVYCWFFFFLLIFIEQVNTKITNGGLESVMHNLDTDILVFWKQAMTYTPQYTYNAILVLKAYFSSIYSYTEFRLDYLTFKLISGSDRMLTTTLGIFEREVEEN